MRPRSRTLLIALVLVALALLVFVPVASAAGGGTAGFSGGGGGFSGGGGGGGGGGKAFFLFLIFREIIILTVATKGAFLLVLIGLFAAWWIANRGVPTFLMYWSAHERQGRAHRRESRNASAASSWLPPRPRTRIRSSGPQRCGTRPRSCSRTSRAPGRPTTALPCAG